MKPSDLYKIIKEKFLNKEIVLYIIFGVLTTLLHNVIYFILRNVGLNINADLANVAANLCSIIFAFFTNKIWVFESRSFKPKVFFREMGAFFLGRGSTFLLDLILFWLLRESLGINEYIARVLVSVVVIVLNYIISKKGVFKKSPKL